MRFDDEAVAIITGAGQGIGRGVALELARNGVSVVVNDVNEQQAETVRAEAEALGAKAVVSAEPVGSLSSGDVIVDTALDAFGHVDILFNNAGIFSSAEIFDVTDANFDRVMDVNFRGVFSLMRAVTKKSMCDRRRGKIINVTSRVALRGRRTESIYAAAKMGVVGLTISAALDLMPFGINVNAVSPAAWTPMADQQVPEIREAMRKSRAQCVLNRVGEVEDVVPTVMFLASRDSDYLTGQVIQATGQPLALL